MTLLGVLDAATNRSAGSEMGGMSRFSLSWSIVEKEFCVLFLVFFLDGLGGNRRLATTMYRGILGKSFVILTVISYWNAKKRGSGFAWLWRS